MHGWALRPDRPEERQSVELIGDQGARVSVIADRYRADLWRAGFGDGHYGFAVPLGILDRVKSLRASVKGSGKSLAGGPILIQADGTQHLASFNDVALHIDQVQRRGALTGWIVDKRNPVRRVDLAIQYRGQALAQTRATRFRSDIDFGGFDTLHGFVLTWNAGLSGFGELVDSTRGGVLAKVKLGT